MPWTSKQQTMALMASNAAQWTDTQRHIAMVHVGCPLRDEGFGKGKNGRRPSIKNPMNSQREFELFMALAESAARALHRGDMMPRPHRSTGKDSWSDVVRDIAAPMRRKIEALWTEAQERLPTKFRPGEPLDAFVQRQTMRDDTRFGAGHTPRTLLECDESQLYRILEGLKPWITREFRAHGMVPWSIQSSSSPSVAQVSDLCPSES